MDLEAYAPVCVIYRIRLVINFSSKENILAVSFQTSGAKEYHLYNEINQPIYTLYIPLVVRGVLKPYLYNE
jgi:hypothetical protein